MKRGIGMGYGIILSAYLTVSVTGRPMISDSPCQCMYSELRQWKKVSRVGGLMEYCYMP